MSSYYGVSRSDGHLTHYGIKGMRPGIRRSQEELDALAGRQSSAADMASKANQKAAVTRYRAVQVQKSSKPNTGSNSGSRTPHPVGLKQSRAYNNAVEKLNQLQAAAPAELAKERPIIDREEELENKTGKRKRNAANSIAYKQSQSDEKYYANRNKYVTPKLSNRR